MDKSEKSLREHRNIEAFEDSLRKHCNIDYNKSGEEIVNSSLSAVLIAFDEWHKNETAAIEQNKRLKEWLKKRTGLESNSLDEYLNKIDEMLDK